VWPAGDLALATAAFKVKAVEAATIARSTDKTGLSPGDLSISGGENVVAALSGARLEVVGEF
jgi:hypothetical protein